MMLRERIRSDLLIDSELAIIVLLLNCGLSNVVEFSDYALAVLSN